MANVSYEELTKLTGYDTPAKLCAYLAEMRIKFKVGKYGRPWTTQAALDSAVLGRSVGSEPAQQDSIRIRSIGRKEA